MLTTVKGKRVWRESKNVRALHLDGIPHSIDKVAWPVQRKFSRRTKFQESCNEHGDVEGKLGVVHWTRCRK